MPLISGDLLGGRYRVGAPIGAGGAATVFLAQEEPSGSFCVVKQLRVDAPEILDSFRAEFAQLSRLSHPSLLRVLDFGAARMRGEVLHYYVAERLSGSSLAELARQSPSTHDLLSAVLDALEGLAVLHVNHIRHGDFTPFNVMVSERGRGTLIDLGCAQPLGATTTLSGTPDFMAPELLERGFGDARADLFSVGRTLQRIFELAKRPPPERAERVIQRLLRTSARDRPSEVGEVLEAFRRKPRKSGGYLTPTRLLGRGQQLAAFEQWLERLLRGQAAPRVLVIQGVPGAGVTRLCSELVWRAQLELPVQRAFSHDAAPVSRALAQAAGLSEPVRTLHDLLEVVGRLREAGQPRLIAVDDARRLDGEQLGLLDAVTRSLGDSGALGLLVAARAPLPDVPAVVVSCPPLADQDVRSWVLPWLPESKLPELVARTGGLPKAIESALRELTHSDHRTGLGMGAALTALGRPARQQLALLFVCHEGRAVPEQWLAREALEELVTAGAIEREGSAWNLTPPALISLREGAISPRELAQAHASVAERLSTLPLTRDVVARLIEHLCLAGASSSAEKLLLDHREELSQKPAVVARQVAVLMRRSRGADVLLAGAALLLAGGEPRLALRAAVRAARAAGAPRDAAAAVVAECLVRLGRPARAQRLLSRLVEFSGAQDSRLLDRLARTLLGRGDYEAARRVAEKALAGAVDATTSSLCRETLGVALGYLGEPDRARAELEQARTGIAGHGSARERFRITGYAATLAFRSGRVAQALEEYGAALSIAEQNELDELLPMGLLNLGTAEQQAGLWGSALRRYERGVTFARAVGRLDTELTLAFNLANLYAEVGAFERAEDALAALEGRVDAAGLAHLKVGIGLVRVEIALARGALPAARSLLVELAPLVDNQAQGREQLELTLRRVELLLAEGDRVEAERLLQDARALPAEVAGELKLALELAQGRLLSVERRPQATLHLDTVRSSAQRGGLAALEASATADLFEAAEALGLWDDARAHRERARRLWERVAADLPTHLGETFWRHPRRRRLNEVSERLATSSTLGERDAEIRAYRRLLSLTRRLSSSRSVAQILDYAVQAAVDLTEAERGFLLLKEPAQASESAKVVASSEPFAPERGPSRSILRRSLEQEEPVITTDALEDPRFATQRSVHSLQLKSVLCVPVLAATGTLGALYVDSSLRRSHFSPADRELLVAFADQVAIALVNAQLREQLEQRTQELERKNRELEGVARGHAREAELLREAVSQQQKLALRYDYSQIIGRSPAMQRVLERLDRVIGSDVNLLVQGESGTGKELVARAVHFNGARKAGPFVGINCAALPEALLESELFGHVRGAFTGADKDKLGLLQAARGGTLFLDEIGELPAGVQSKLLRVLQEREVRPLGAVEAEPLDLRLVAATHRDLQQEVARGSFREDLYYRIAVVNVTLPPLRDRLEDLPALASRILEGLAQDANRKPPVLAHDALRKLSAHPFRGNVRELQNILTRAFVLGSGARVRAQDVELAEQVRVSQRSGSRKEFQEQERARILEALQRTRWNISAVSSALAIPRATLHRKLKRYGLQRT